MEALQRLAVVDRTPTPKVWGVSFRPWRDVVPPTGVLPRHPYEAYRESSL